MGNRRRYLPEDPEVAAVVDKYWKTIAPRYGEILGQAAANSIERGDDLAPYNLMADSIRETFDTDIELENIGGVCAPLAKGNITWADLVDMDPFDNTIVTFKISGRQLKEALQSERPAVSGIRYRVEDGVITEVMVGGMPTDDASSSLLSWYEHALIQIRQASDAVFAGEQNAETPALDRRIRDQASY